MRDSIPTPCACNPQVLYRSDTFFIHDSGSGHTFPASRKLVAGRFGELFAQCVERESGIWITFDDDVRADMERIAAKANTELRQVLLRQVMSVHVVDLVNSFCEKDAVQGTKGRAA